MAVSQWLRVILMCVALAGVIVIMRRLNQSPGSMNVAAQARTAKMIEGINLCPTRVTRLETAELSVFEVGMSWFRQIKDEREKLDAVAVEKWFSEHCTLVGRPAGGLLTTREGGAQAALKVFFVSGSPQTLLQGAGGDYGWMGHWFSSAQVDQALKALQALPAARD